MVAALYVERDGAYYGLDNVDPWDAERDARTYAGPWPVVAHPPCERWGRFWHGSTRKPHQFKLGDDGGSSRPGGPPSRHVAEVNSTDVVQNERNAALIAAAPDMFEALRLITELSDDQPARTAWNMVHIARAALLKAQPNCTPQERAEQNESRSET